MDTGSQDTAHAAVVDAGSAASARPADTPPRVDAPAWRAAGVGMAFGMAAVVWSLHARLPDWVAVGAVAGLLALGLLCMAGLRFVVDQDKARRTVFYTGEGQGSWFAVNVFGMFQIPWVFITGITETVPLVLSASGLGIVVAVANQTIVSRCMTRRPQPAPEIVPLG
ncbi:hypothetical protein E4A47_07455 [Micrococcus flavus]|uniref:Uncharacterized protein n=1 Tax=Micrococcus flavus TaxID=384602 RepID=A0A4Y8X2G7_9MICC|nr:hypothetical protein [Micrococcus flavus]MBB4882514.1 hypothetical protein [Micrococcus flavus]TFI02098.1 hypothetical protein E4A47_07455 [Micrococcus flavus]GGK38042.1 hypothetical protein GCM10007073_00860 [Micrococcus flavus]